MFKELLINQFKKKKSSEIQDYIKFIYQATFGGEHLITDKEKTLSFLKKESKDMIENVPFYEPLYEVISNDYVRVNLRPFLKAGYSLESLNEYFANQKSKNNFSLLEERLLIFESLVNNEDIKLDKTEVATFLDTYKKDNYPVYHHSNTYRENYFPNYRVVPFSFITEEMKEFQIKSFISYIYDPNILTLISIEGSCASGKTTIAQKISDNFDVTIIHADDFFLNDTDKQKEIGVGEYIDYRRLSNLLKNLSLGKTINYQKYDCTKKEHIDTTIKVKPIVIVEGVYSYNQYLRQYFDYLIFVSVNRNLQLERLEKRSSPFIYKRFIEEWIPREDKYFKTLNILNNANIVI